MIRISNIQNGSVIIDRSICIAYDVDSRFIISKGDLLIAMSGATTGKMGIYKDENEAYLNQRVGNIKIITRIGISERYRNLFMLSQSENILKQAYGGAQPNISSTAIEEMYLPLPPISEQKRIVDAVEHIMNLIDFIESGTEDISHSITKTKEKILSLAISGKLVPQDPADEPAIELLKRINPDFKPCDNSHYEDLPIGWSICTLYDICDTINGLWKGKNPPFINVGVIRNANFTKDFNLDYSKIEYIDVEQRAFEKRNLEDGDLIVEKSGGSDNFPVGRSILYQGESGKYSFSNFTMALRIKDKSLIHSKYLYFVILHKYLSGEMTQMQTQTTGLHNLLSDKYMSMPIPMPPTNEQNRIIGCIEELLNQLKNIKTVL